MRRAVARGRIVPQSLSTDPRIGRVSLKAALLFPMMWINCDDQGRISGDPDEIKYAVCPNIDHITKSDIPVLLKELEEQGFLKVYTTSKTNAIQMLDWWEVQRLQWAWPSAYSPPDGWQDRLRYKKSAKEVVTENWDSGESSAESSPENSPERSGEDSPLFPLTTSLEEEKEEGRGRGRGRGRGKSPEFSGETPSPSPDAFNLINCFKQAWGRSPNSRESAQLRDLEKEISSAGGATAEQIHDAFKEAAVQNKLHISYVRAILLDWLGVERNRSP